MEKLNNFKDQLITIAPGTTGVVAFERGEAGYANLRSSASYLGRLFDVTFSFRRRDESSAFVTCTAGNVGPIRPLRPKDHIVREIQFHIKRGKKITPEYIRHMLTKYDRLVKEKNKTQSMKVIIKLSGVTYGFEATEAELSEALDKAIRENKELWEKVVRPVAGRYQGELVKKEMEHTNIRNILRKLNRS